MFKERFEKEQPIAYKVLEYGLKEDKLSHAYLFAGPKGTPKLEAAILFAQSLVCSNRQIFACEECTTCIRVQDKQYADLVFLDGTTESIKKEQILQLQQQFSKTALEEGNHKIYIINAAENATVEALNSLLKFLEEPSGIQTTAILITDQIDKILPTIRSRCQIIRFKPLTVEFCYQQCLEQEIDPLDSYLLSQLIRNVEEISEFVETDEYQNARYLFQTFIKEVPYNIDMALTTLQKDGFSSKNKNKDQQLFQYFVDFCILFYRDLQTQTSIEDEWWKKQLALYTEKRIDATKLLTIVLEIKDSFNRYVNLPLLIDQMGYRIKEVILK